MKKVYLSLVSLLVLFGLNFNVYATDNINDETASNEELEVKSVELLKSPEIKYVAQISDTKYETLDEAIKQSKDNDTIILLDDATCSGINLNINLTIDGNNHTINFVDNGIAIWGKTLTFKNVIVNIEDIGKTPYSEWNWMTICASKNSTLNLYNSKVTLDGKNAGNAHAIYFTGNDKLNLNNSILTIKNYKQDALEWDGGDSGYNVNFTNSTYNSDNNRSGFTGTFVVKSDNSNINVINSTGNGSNGSHFEIINKSLVNFNNNNSHGLSAGLLTIKNSTVNAIDNGANGITANDKLNFSEGATVTITGNDCKLSSKWTIPASLSVGGKDSIIDETVTLTITDNDGSGIYVKPNASLDLQTGTIVRNIADKLGIGGGINNHGTINIASNVRIYNNYASSNADDIYNADDSNLSFGKTMNDWTLIKTRADEKYLNDCSDAIDNWYEDGPDKRWEAHGETAEEDHTVVINSGIIKSETSIKAAHGVIGKLVIKFVDNKGNTLSDTLEYTDIAGTDYTTSAKEFDDYELIEIKGNQTGKYSKETTEVIYVYEFVSEDDENDDFPITGVTDNYATEIATIISTMLLITSIIFKKRFN